MRNTLRVNQVDLESKDESERCDENSQLERKEDVPMA